MDARDEAYDRLTGADPADGATTRDGVLRAKVDALTGDVGTPAAGAAGAADGAGGSAGSDSAAATGAAPVPVPGGTTEGAQDAPDGTVDELAPRRRRRPALLVAAVVAGAVVVGGGGFAVGAVTAGEELPASDALPPITLGGGQGAAGGPPEAAGVRAGAATEEMSAAADSATSYDTMMPSWFDGRATFSQQGLSTTGGEATAYAYDATQVATQEGAARAADALGVEGEPRWEGGSWSVGPTDGAGPTLWMSADATAYLSYNAPAADPWRCEETVALQDQQAASDAGDPDVQIPECTQPTGTVSAKKAVGELTAVMERLGVDPDGFEFEPSTDSEPGSRWITAHEVVDGQRTGAAWSATVSKEGVAWLDGFLATRTELGTYPVISPADAVERLGDPRFGQNLWPVTYSPALETRMMEEPTDSGPTAPPAPPAAGDAVPWPVTDVTITEARLGLAQEHRTDAATLLLPAYELSDADGNVWTVVAVADDALDMTDS
jgi:hypothetical protein